MTLEVQPEMNAEQIFDRCFDHYRADDERRTVFIDTVPDTLLFTRQASHLPKRIALSRGERGRGMDVFWSGSDRPSTRLLEATVTGDKIRTKDPDKLLREGFQFEGDFVDPESGTIIWETDSDLVGRRLLGDLFVLVQVGETVEGSLAKMEVHSDILKCEDGEPFEDWKLRFETGTPKLEEIDDEPDFDNPFFSAGNDVYGDL